MGLSISVGPIVESWMLNKEECEPEQLKCSIETLKGIQRIVKDKLGKEYKEKPGEIIESDEMRYSGIHFLRGYATAISLEDCVRKNIASDPGTCYSLGVFSGIAYAREKDMYDEEVIKLKKKRNIDINSQILIFTRGVQFMYSVHEAIPQVPELKDGVLLTCPLEIKLDETIIRSLFDGNGRLKPTRFPHLIYHEDNIGFYLPIDFEKPLWNEGTASIGSSIRLKGELDVIKNYMNKNNINKENGIRDILELLDKMATLSIKYKLPIRFE